MKKILAAATIALATAIPVAHAGPFDSITGLGKSSGGDDVAASQDKLVTDYILASKIVLASRGKMASALGLKTEAASLQATADGLSKDNLDKVNGALSPEASKVINDAQAAHPVLDDASKKEYLEGLVGLAGGVVKYVSLKGSIESFANSMKSASPMMIPKLKTGLAIVKSLPTNAKSLADTVKTALAFAKEQKIQVPNDVASSTSVPFN